VGRVLGRTFSIWFRNLVPFTTISVVVHAPLVVWAVLLLRDDEAPMAGQEAWDAVEGILAGVLGIVLTAALTFGVVQHLRGKPASFGATVGTGLRRLFPALGAGALAGVLTFLPMIAVLLLGFATESYGLFLLAIPALVLTLMIQAALWVTVPAAVVERPGVGGALRRSTALTRGSRWRVFGINVVLGAIGMALTLALGVPVTEDPTWEDVRRTMVVNVVLTVLVAGPWSAVASAVGYHDLRVGKEGADVEDLARVFE
jgi:hypothetical protein